ncbi:type I-E CRISPR-associated protein Cas5/CasD [Kutzneria sp. NPDC052558]|uniref:type I-E CRISPR-associated protein Cas5/CasD n=1 Tax=Kutzneria sp. NPDC052558 TaxID=3364121 RepID=UPI0037CB71BC
MPVSLALCFDAPMQSWGVRSHGVIRDTAREPTKSGVVGVLAAALGVARENDAAIARLAALQLAIRVDREGVLERDFHTTQNVPTTMGTGHRTVVSERYYLADALFLVVIHGDPGLLADAAAALATPRWQLFFGRKAFVPVRALFGAPGTAHGLSDAPAEVVLERHPWLELDSRIRATEHGKTDRLRLRTVSDCPPRTTGAEVRHDVPVRFTQGDRRHATRTVATGSVPLTSEMIPAGDPSCS